MLQHSANRFDGAAGLHARDELGGEICDFEINRHAGVMRDRSSPFNICFVAILLGLTRLKAPSMATRRWNSPVAKRVALLRQRLG